MSLVHEDLYEPGCRTPQPPVKRWKAPPRKIPPSQRPHTARNLGAQHEKESNPLATTQVGVSNIPRILPVNAQLSQAILEAAAGEGSNVSHSKILGPSETQKNNFRGLVPCAEDTQDERCGGTEKYLKEATRDAFERYDYSKFSRSEGQADTVAVGPGARVETFIDRTMLAEDAEAEQLAGPNPPRRSPTKIKAGATPQRDPNFINRYLYAKVADAQDVAPPGSPRKMRPSSASTTLSTRTQSKHKDLQLLRQSGMPGTFQGTQTSGMSAREARRHYEKLAQQEEAVLYAAEVERAREAVASRKPAMRLHDLKVTTFDANMAPNTLHKQLEDDIKRDEFLLKRKRLREGELERRAVLEQRVKSARASHQEKMQWSFERSLALDLPFTAAKAHEAVTAEWAEQMEEDALSKGFNLNANAKEQIRGLASAKAKGVLEGVRNRLRGSQPSFGITPKQAGAEAALAFMKSQQNRPKAHKLLGVESQRIVHRNKKRVPLKPPRPQLSCNLTVPSAVAHHTQASATSNIVDDPRDLEYARDLAAVAELPDA